MDTTYIILFASWVVTFIAWIVMFLAWRRMVRANRKLIERIRREEELRGLLTQVETAYEQSRLRSGIVIVTDQADHQDRLP